jgi:hypothetical protein
MTGKRALLLVFALVILGGCATMPTGPLVPVMPGPGKPFEVFMADDTVCRQWAQQQIGGASPSQTANQNVATGATAGALVGGAMGAAIGAATGNPAAGAAIGGATGLLGGTAMGSNAGAASEYQLQRRYDIAYQQCMYAKGNQIPGVVRHARTYPPPPPSRTSGPWVVVPGQYVNGKWVPEHRVQVPSSSKEQVPAPGPPVQHQAPQPSSP